MDRLRRLPVWPGILGAVVWLLLLVPVLAMARYGFGFLDGDLLRAPFFMIRQMAATQPWFSIHTACGAAALLLGWVQIWPAPRRRWPRFHRAAGRAYAAACLAGAAAAVPVALHSVGGSVASALLIGQAALWAGLLWPAVAAARRGRFAAHRAWIVRHYGLTCSAILLRAIMATGLPLSYPVQIAASIVLALVLAELALRAGPRRSVPGRRLSSPSAPDTTWFDAE
jgi:uncharacterized membrane protein